MSDLRDLEILIRSRYPFVVVDSPEETRVREVLGRTAETLGLPLFEWTLTEGLRRTGAESAVYDTREAAKALAALAAMQAEGLYFLRDLPAFLSDPAIVRGLLDLVEPFARDRRALVMSGAGLQLPSALSPYAARYHLALPDRDRLARVAADFLSEARRRHSVSIELGPAQRERLLESLRGLTTFEAERLLAQVVLDDHRLDTEDLGRLDVLRRERIASGGLLELLPASDLPALCGLENLRDWLRKRSVAWKPGARDFGVEPPRGMLLLGVPGCGKTLAARTVAADWNLPLLQLHVGRIFDKFIGESEARLEAALAEAERMAPCVLLVDEVEKAFASGRSDGDGGLSRRLVGRLLGWLQARSEPVFVVATCNGVEDLPPELTRKGRFDETFFVDLPDRAARREILAAHLRKRARDPEAFDLDTLADAAHDFSGAEIEQAVVAGLYSAFAEGARLGSSHILAELRTTLPLARTRAEEVAALRSWASGRTVPADRPHRAA